MSNTYFQFKKFLIEQGSTAMKVSTDACIQGAWTPVVNGVRHVLDIGTGTGLLSLMLAQRNDDILIDAVELDTDAAAQAQQNIAASPWAGRISLIQGDARDVPFAHTYDLIICNPPFFQNSLLGNNDNRNKARHTLTFTSGDLLAILEKYLSTDGYAAVMLPPAEFSEWQHMIETKGWIVFKKLLVQPKQDAAMNRVIGLCARNKQMENDERLVIYEQDHSYTPAFTALLSPFYLKL